MKLLLYHLSDDNLALSGKYVTIEKRYTISNNMNGGVQITPFLHLKYAYAWKSHYLEYLEIASKT